MPRSWLPAILRPDYTWTPRKTSLAEISNEIPPTPKPHHPFTRRVIGHLHSFLNSFSIYYCRWLGIPFNNQIVALPFGLLLKWSDGTQLEEVLATQVCYAAGLPTPRIISYGYHPNFPHAPVSILMTRLPGAELGEIYESLDATAKATALTEMRIYLSAVRAWKSPWGDELNCSITGGAIRSVRVPDHIVGPCANAQEFHAALLAPAWNSEYAEAEYKEKLERARKLQILQQRRPGVKFTHGDFKHHNILVDYEGHITGFLDWESAGWYPEFWEYTTALRFIPKGFWWYVRILDEAWC